METETGRDQAALLSALIIKWGEHYAIFYSQGQYHAQRRDTGALAHGIDAAALELALEEDYRAGPKPPGVPPVTPRVM